GRRAPVEAHRQRAGERPPLRGLLTDAPGGREHARERLEYVLRGDVLEVLERVQQAGAEVDRSVGDGEQPAVARHEVGALPEVHPDLEPGTGRPIDPVVASRGDTERARSVALYARATADPRGRAVGREHVAGAHLDLLFVPPHDRAGHPSVGEDGLEDLRALPEERPRLLRAAREELVEVVPRADEA